MSTRRSKQNRLFHELAADLAKVRPRMMKTVCCPLCLQDFGIEAAEKLSVEHIIPSRLGGTTRTLTCMKCNNDHGSRLDRHLIAAMRAFDGLEGYGPITTTWQSPMGHIAIDLFFRKGSRDEPITLQVVGEASNCSAVESIPTQLVDGSMLNLRLDLDFIPERYWRGAIRAAYLAVFSVQGYEYLFSDGASQARNALNGAGSVQPKVVMQAFPSSEPPSDLLIMPYSFTDVGDVFTVLLRLRSERTRYLVVLLPGKPGCDWNLLGRLSSHAPRLRIETTPETWTSRLLIDLGYDPVSEMGPDTLLPRA